MAKGLSAVVAAVQKRPAAGEDSDALLDSLEAWAAVSGVDVERLVRLLLDGDEPQARLFNGATLT